MLTIKNKAPFTSLGIDLSTSATGLVLLQANGTPQPDTLVEDEVTVKGLEGIERYRAIVGRIMELIHDRKPDRIVLEGYSLNMKKSSSVIPLVEIGGILRLMLHLDGLRWFDPRAGQVKKFATGLGTTPKDKVMMHVFKRWGFEAKTNNTADAYVCAALGLAQANRLPGITQPMRKIAGEIIPVCN